MLARAVLVTLFWAAAALADPSPLVSGDTLSCFNRIDGAGTLSAVAVSGNLMFVVLAATQMLGVGTTTLVSHAVGRKDHDTARLVFNQSLGLSATLGLLFFAIAAALTAPYANTLSADAGTAR